MLKKTEKTQLRSTPCGGPKKEKKKKSGGRETAVRTTHRYLNKQDQRVGRGVETPEKAKLSRLTE